MSSHKGRSICVIVSSVLALIAVICLSICVFSAGYRWAWVADAKGYRSYGLIRFCYIPDENAHTNGAFQGASREQCHLRARAPSNMLDVNYKDYFDQYEMTSLVLLCAAIVCAVMSICFAVCSICTVFGILAHSTMLLISGLCGISGFIVYTYFNELKDNQNEYDTSSNPSRYHYGWAYYTTGVACAILIGAFVCSLFASTFLLADRKRKHKIETVVL